jgi:hypothetical protein
MVDICNLIDLGYTGEFWTWEKKVTGGSYTRVRLDRALGSAEWSAQFLLACITHVNVATSDHRALLLQFDDEAEVTQRGPIQFRYETMWERHEDLKPLVTSGWNSTGGGATVSDVRGKLRSLSHQLGRWGVDTFGSVRKEIKKLKNELDLLRSD